MWLFLGYPEYNGKCSIIVMAGIGPRKEGYVMA